MVLDFKYHEYNPNQITEKENKTHIYLCTWIKVKSSVLPQNWIFQLPCYYYIRFNIWERIFQVNKWKKTFFHPSLLINTSLWVGFQRDRGKGTRGGETGGTRTNLSLAECPRKRARSRTFKCKSQCRRKCYLGENCEIEFSGRKTGFAVWLSGPHAPLLYPYGRGGGFITFRGGGVCVCDGDGNFQDDSGIKLGFS